MAPVNGVCSTDILVLRPKEEIDRVLLVVAASTDELIDSLSAGSTGTRMPRASWADLASSPLPMLSNSDRKKLGFTLEPLLEHLTHFTNESLRLVSLRDTLLPELLSGRIRVPEAKEAVEEVL